MFDHVTIRVSDRSASEAIYRTVLGELGIDVLYADEWFVEWGELSLKASEERPVTTGLHIGFVAYGAFLLDPDGSSAELVNHNRSAELS